jgi:hypothetical protein
VLVEQKKTVFMFAEQIKTISRRKHFTLKQQKQGQKYTYGEPKKWWGEQNMI